MQTNRKIGFTILEVLIGAAIFSVVIGAVVSMLRNSQLVSKQLAENLEATNFRNSLTLIFQTPKICNGALLAPGSTDLASVGAGDIDIGSIRIGSSGPVFATAGQRVAGLLTMDSMKLSAPTLIQSNITIGSNTYDKYFTSFTYKLKGQDAIREIASVRETPIAMTFMANHATGKIEKCGDDVCSMFVGLTNQNGQCVSPAPLPDVTYSYDAQHGYTPPPAPFVAKSQSSVFSDLGLSGLSTVTVASFIRGSRMVTIDATTNLQTWGVTGDIHGGGQVTAAIVTNLRTISVASHWVRWYSHEPPYIVTNGQKVVLGYTGGAGEYAYSMDLAPGEFILKFYGYPEVWDDAGNGGSVLEYNFSGAPYPRKKITPVYVEQQ